MTYLVVHSSAGSSDPVPYICTPWSPLPVNTEGAVRMYQTAGVSAANCSWTMS